MRGLQRMVEQDKQCIDGLTQFAAATRALQAFSLELLEEHLTTCVVQADGALPTRPIPTSTMTRGTAMTTTTYTVRGMTCDHCVNSVSFELGSLPGVSKVDVDLATGKVTVTSEQPLHADAVRAAVDEAGYELVA